MRKQWHLITFRLRPKINSDSEGEPSSGHSVCSSLSGMPPLLRCKAHRHPRLVRAYAHISHECGTKSPHLGSASHTSVRTLSSCAAARASRRLQCHGHTQRIRGALRARCSSACHCAFKGQRGPDHVNTVRCGLHAVKSESRTSSASKSSSSKGRSAPQRTA